jgi:L-glyceraldehyde 3-phosphate reductase
MGALAHIVKQGKALYAGISNYPADLTKKTSDLMKSFGVPLLIHQPKYSMFERWVENGLLDTLEHEGMGCIAFSPLAQGLLTDKYLKGIPDDSRAAKNYGHLKKQEVNEETMNKVMKLSKIAQKRNQNMAQLALAWLLKDQRVTSVLIGASSASQLEQNLKTLENLNFTNDELTQIENILT